MKFKNMMITAYACAVIVSVSGINPAYAYSINPPYNLPIETEADSAIGNNNDQTSNILNLTVDSAVEYGLEHNISIEMLENKIQLALISEKNAKKNSSDLKKAKNTLKDALNQIDYAENELNKAQEQVDKAKSILSQGIAPLAIPFQDPSGNPFVIAAGSSIRQALLSNGFSENMADVLVVKITESVEKELTSKQDTIDENAAALAEAQITLEAKQEEFKSILSDTSEKLDTKINYGTVISLDADDASKLMITMAGVNLDVTRYAKNIYKNQIAMLIQKNYYDALYAGKIYELKKIAMGRGEKQYKMVKLSYDNGMKAKDDLILSKMYYDGTIIACRLAEADYKNALTKLKENMNLDMDTEITLEDSMLAEVTAESLTDGLKSGLTNRIEIQQTLGQLKIYELNEDILKSRAEYKANANGIKEAELLRESAELNLDKSKTTIKSEIKQSYETMVAAGDMLNATSELVKNAEEVVVIANLKYQQGFGAENSLLKQMNLEESSGTIIELISAQEKLSEVEAQVAQIRYGYTMAKIKYYNDAGILIY